MNEQALAQQRRRRRGGVVLADAAELGALAELDGWFAFWRVLTASPPGAGGLDLILFESAT